MSAFSATADFDRVGPRPARPPAIDAIANGLTLIGVVVMVGLLRGVFDVFMPRPAHSGVHLPVDTWPLLVDGVLALIYFAVAHRVRIDRARRIEALVLTWIGCFFFGVSTVLFVMMLFMDTRSIDGTWMAFVSGAVAAVISIATLVRVERGVTIEYFARLKAKRSRLANASG